MPIYVSRKIKGSDDSRINNCIIRCFNISILNWLIAQGTNKIHFTMHKYICITAYKGIIHTRQEIRCQGANNQKRKKKKKEFPIKCRQKPTPICIWSVLWKNSHELGRECFFRRNNVGGGSPLSARPAANFLVWKFSINKETKTWLYVDENGYGRARNRNVSAAFLAKRQLQFSCVRRGVASRNNLSIQASCRHPFVSFRSRFTSASLPTVSPGNTNQPRFSVSTYSVATQTAIVHPIK